MNWKYLAGILLLILAGMFYWLRQPVQHSNKINLSYNICLAEGAGFQKTEADSSTYLTHLKAYWVDTSSQYFSGLLINSRPDTFLVSVFNQASLRRAQELLDAAGFQQLRAESQKKETTIVRRLDRAPNGTFVLRYLIDNPRFKVVAMVEQAGRDSSLMERAFEEAYLTKYIETCL